jgi:hypothetical protein
MRRAHRGAKLQPYDRRRRHGRPRDRDIDAIPGSPPDHAAPVARIVDV